MRNKLIILLLIFPLLVYVCYSGEVSIIGSWQIEVQGQILVMTFYDDQSITFGGQSGYWEILENMLYTVLDGTEEFFLFSIEKETLTLTDIMTGQSLIFTRAKEEKSPTDKKDTESSTSETKESEPSTSIPGVLWFIRLDGSKLSWCNYNPQTDKITVKKTYNKDTITEPALWGDGEITIFAVKHATHPKLIGHVGKKPFTMNLPPNMDLEVKHPTISKDGKLLAFSMRSSKHVGNVDVYDWDTGDYDHTYMAVGSWYKVFSVNLETGKQQAIYHDDALVPDLMKNRGLGPVFSPTENILVYGDSYRLYVCDAYSGKNLRTFETPSVSSGGWTGRALISSYSGMAFTPDGKEVVYLSQGEAEIDISPNMIIFVNIKTGKSKFFQLPADISGGTPYGVICLDFSPDGQYLVFSVTQTDLNQPIICLLDVYSGSLQYLTGASYAFDPVWKGR